MSTTATRKVIPGMGVMSKPFENGYLIAQNNPGFVGWAIQYAPNERTVVQFLELAAKLIAESDDKYCSPFVAGLLAGWLRREQ